MGLFDNILSKKPAQTSATEKKSDSYSAFAPVGKGNLSLPFVQKEYRMGEMVMFGQANTYPQLLTQLYYSSPLHSSICNFKVNAVNGGGDTFDDLLLTAQQKIELKFIKRILKSKDLSSKIAIELILHGRFYIILKIEKGRVVGAKHITSDKVRKGIDGCSYYVGFDFATSSKATKYREWSVDCEDGEYMYAYEQYSVGQDFYPIPSYTSAANYIYLSGELSNLQKANLQNSIFPSLVIKFPKKIETAEEKQAVADTINNLKGSSEAGKVAVFSANGVEMLPIIDTIQPNDNDKLFREQHDIIVEQICFAHTIDPILMGVRTTGALGNGSDIKQAYVIFEKNIVMPLRDSIEAIINDLISINGLPNVYSINNFQIINEKIIEVDEDTQSLIDKISLLPPILQSQASQAVANDIISNLIGKKTAQ